MPVDFDRLVQVPVQNVFGEPVIIDPVDSRRGQPPYRARAVWRSLFLDVPLMDETALGEQASTFFFRLADFELGVPYPETKGPIPMPRDRVTRVKTGFMYFLSDVDDDGQGGQNIRGILVMPDHPK